MLCVLPQGTHIKPVLQQIKSLTGLNMGGKTRSIALILTRLAAMLQNMPNCTFFVARFSVP